MPKPNDRIGPYQLINRLGKGSFGEVWLAQPENEKSPPVALKLPNDPDLDFDALLQETAVWARACKHPNVVEFIAARVFDHQAVIVSEFVPDGSLEQWLKRNGGRAPSVESAIEMTCGILDGLEHLHAKSIIHRDLKPANILMDGNTPRLADFGHSRVLASTMHSSIVAGTPAYMAPEAFDAVRNEQTDVWSIGVLLYQMLAGRMPFSQRDAASLMKAILMTEPLPLPTNLPGWLRQVVETAMSKEPEQRYQSAAKMRAALLRPTRQAQPPEPVVKPPEPEIETIVTGRGKVIVDISPKPEPPIQPPPKREPVITAPPPRPEPVAINPKPQPARSNSGKWLGAGLAAIVIAVAIYAMTQTSFEPTRPIDWSGDLVEMVNGVPLPLMKLPGGSFLMGSPDGEGASSEKPQHRVTVSSFYIAKYEVTQAQWKAVMSNNPSNFRGDDLPVENVSWNDIKEFLNKTGNRFRLPTEAEWEYAARAGSTAGYSFGNDGGQLGDFAWFRGNSGSQTHLVGQKKPNTFGLFDMHGNVWELCSDWYSGDYYAECLRQGAMTDPQGPPGTGSYRVIRGGGWADIDVDCRSAFRSVWTSGNRYGGLGFRLVRIGR